MRRVALYPLVHHYHHSMVHLQLAMVLNPPRNHRAIYANATNALSAVK